ncbi:uncharacterized protein LOC106145166 isoform X1 [Ictidomys tridecemlineatus]|uniref:uncharacterized protein LOC106145166 isoform X2 n=1 Tax=Ictidomys tridecemlineatus TaxID=43179 RepID=UPI001A9D8A33|nr:uncharacterized protein LOC106145166 isoform X2 [Ictidomys tridecemlineatus]
MGNLNCCGKGEVLNAEDAQGQQDDVPAADAVNDFPVDEHPKRKATAYIRAASKKWRNVRSAVKRLRKNCIQPEADMAISPQDMEQEFDSAEDIQEEIEQELSSREEDKESYLTEEFSKQLDDNFPEDDLDDMPSLQSLPLPRNGRLKALAVTGRTMVQDHHHWPVDQYHQSPSHLAPEPHASARAPSVMSGNGH